MTIPQVGQVKIQAVKLVMQVSTPFGETLAKTPEENVVSQHQSGRSILVFQFCSCIATTYCQVIFMYIQILTFPCFVFQIFYSPKWKWSFLVLV